MPLTSTRQININADRLLDGSPNSLTAIQRALRRCRVLLWLLLVADIVTSLILFCGAHGFRFPSAEFEEYHLQHSLLDLLAITAARIAGVVTQSRAGWWIGFLSCVLAICKAIVFSHQDEPATAVALVLFAVPMSASELYASARCMALHARTVAVAELKAKAGEGADSGELESKIKLVLEPPRGSIAGYARILKPYFWPHGIVHKLRTTLTFLVMAGSKACNLLAPLSIGAAAQKLSDGSVPYTELAMYCGFRFGSSALSELQKLIYIRVKQHAFAEIAEGTFRTAV